MGNQRKVIFAAALAVTGLAGFIWFLTGQGLDHAEKWVSVSGVGISTALGVAGVSLGWLTWRQSRPVRQPVRVRASGAGSAAIGGNNRGKIVTRVSGSHPHHAPLAPASGEVEASGDGAVAVGRDNHADIRTEVTRTNPDGCP